MRNLIRNIRRIRKIKERILMKYIISMEDSAKISANLILSMYYLFELK